MSDFGTENSNATLTLTTKMIEMLGKLVKYIHESYRDRAKEELTKEQLSELVEARTQREALNKLNGVYGMVKFDEMQKTGKEMDMLGVSLSFNEINKFAEYSKREGVVFSAMEDSRKGDEKQEYLVHIYKNDFDRAKGIFGKIALENKIIAIDKQINALKDKGDNLSEQDKVDLDFLVKSREDMRRGVTYEHNNIKNMSAFEDAVLGAESLGRKSNFDHSFDRYTGGVLNENTEKYVCERTNPNNYIHCESYRDTYKNEEYIRTNYEVFKNGESAFSCDDGRFDGRSSSHWYYMKQEMKDIGGFSDDLLIFDSKTDMERYQRLFIEQQKELRGMFDDGNKDFGNIQAQLLSQLDINNAKINNAGEVVDKDTGILLSLDDDLSLAQLAVTAESITIVKQLANYDVMASLEMDIALTRKDISDMKSRGAFDDFSYDEAINELSELDAKYAATLILESSLLQDRSRINGAQAELHTRSYQDISVPELKEQISSIENKINNSELRIADIGKEISYEDFAGNTYSANKLRVERTNVEADIANMRSEYEALSGLLIIKDNSLGNDNVAVSNISDINARVASLENEIKEKTDHNYKFGQAIDYSDDPSVRASERKQLASMEKELSDLRGELDTLKQSPEYADSRRADRINDADDIAESMTAYKGKIEDKRQQLIKDNPIADKTLNKSDRDIGDR